MFSDSQIDSSGILTRSELLHKLKNSFTGNTGFSSLLTTKKDVRVSTDRC
jgi:hypothetical protein